MQDEPISTLLRRFAGPAVIANLISALYTIVDQIFIGQGVGYLGNAATNIAFPITTISMALALMLGIGTAANFNLEMGRGNVKRAEKMVGTTFGSLIILGVVMSALLLLFTKPLMSTFGATAELMPYVLPFVRITALSLPFFLISTACNSIVRADGSARYSMFGMVVGAILNMILNPIFIFGFKWGIAGSAWATVISQIISGCIFLAYIPNFRNITVGLKDLIPRPKLLKPICALGLGPMFQQLSVTLVQIVTNNLIKVYGVDSTIGPEIPVAVVGVVSKINQVYTAIVLGITQGAQPILGFNYGAKAYGRVRETFKLMVTINTLISLIAFLAFQLFTHPIISLFGTASSTYMNYAVYYMHVFFAMVFVNGFQTSSGIFFSSIGKAKNSVFLILSKQIILLLPLLVIMTLWLGVDNLMIANPIADFLSALLAAILIRNAFKKMPA